MYRSCRPAATQWLNERYAHPPNLHRYTLPLRVTVTSLPQNDPNTIQIVRPPSVPPYSGLIRLISIVSSFDYVSQSTLTTKSFKNNQSSTNTNEHHRLRRRVIRKHHQSINQTSPRDQRRQTQTIPTTKSPSLMNTLPPREMMSPLTIQISET